MQQIKTGDRCPLCGQIVTTTDPEILAELLRPPWSLWALTSRPNRIDIMIPPGSGGRRRCGLPSAVPPVRSRRSSPALPAGPWGHERSLYELHRF